VNRPEAVHKRRKDMFEDDDYNDTIDSPWNPWDDFVSDAFGGDYEQAEEYIEGLLCE
jgi:hypothetical protein